MVNKRTSLSERETRPIDSLFTPTKESKHTNIQTNKQITKVNKETSNQEEYIRKTYYLTQHLIDSLSIYSTFERIDISEIVRESLGKNIPEKYQEMAKKMK